MILYFSIILIIVLLSSSFWPKDQWTNGYISMEQSNNVKGIFTLLIFLGHSASFIEVNGLLDTPYLMIISHLEQAVVVMYLFYSGYGMTESYKKRKTDYIRSLPSKRIVPLIFNFTLSIVLHIIMCFYLGVLPSVSQIILSFLGWISIGNYNWFVFVIISLYILFGLSFAFSSKIQSEKTALKTGALIMTVLSVALILLFRFPGKRPTYFYDTLLTFPLGIWFSIYKEKIDTYLSSRLRFLGAVVVCLLIYINAFMFRDMSFWIYEIWTVSATIIFLFITMKIKISSRILTFFGKLALPMLLLQGLPFNILSHLKVNDYPYLFVFLSFVISVLISVLFNKFTKLIGTTKK